MQWRGGQVCAIALLLAAPAIASHASADPAWRPSAPVTTTLANGLRVVVAEDHRLPIVGMTLRYGVGAAAEPSGLAARFAPALVRERRIVAPRLRGGARAGSRRPARARRLLPEPEHRSGRPRGREAVPCELARAAIRGARRDRLESEPQEAARSHASLRVAARRHRGGDPCAQGWRRPRRVPQGRRAASHPDRHGRQLRPRTDPPAPGARRRRPPRRRALGGAASRHPPLPITSPARRVHLVDRPQSALSQVRWSWTGATPTERLTLRVLAELLSSRAHVRIARELQLTEDYEIGYVGERAGLWLTISGRVVSTRTAELLREIGSIVDDLASSPSSAAIDSAKTRVLGRHVLSIERARDLSALLARDTFGDFQSDQLSRIEDGIRAVSTADVQVLAKRMLSSRTGTVVIVGDEATLRGPACGRRLGCSRAVRSRRQRAQALTSGRA